MPKLTEDDLYAISRAREVRNAEHGYDAASLAARCGALEWHVDELLRLVDWLSDPPPRPKRKRPHE